MLQWVPRVIEKHAKVPEGLHILLKGRHAHLCIGAQRPKSLGVWQVGGWSAGEKCTQLLAKKNSIRQLFGH